MWRLVDAKFALAQSVCAVTSKDKQLHVAHPCSCAKPGCDGLIGHVSAGKLCDLRMGPRVRPRRRQA